MNKIFRIAKLRTKLLTILTISSIGLVVYAETETEPEIEYETITNGIYPLKDEYNQNVKTLIFGETGITIKMDDQWGYKWGTSEPGTDLPTIEENHMADLWGGGSDTPENGYSPNPDLSSMVRRRGPCDTGYHVPSAGEWSKLIVTWCSLFGCEDSDLTYLNASGGAGKLAALTGNNFDSLRDAFQNDLLNMYASAWSSSSRHINKMENDTTAYVLNAGNSAHIEDIHNERTVVRCMRNEVLYPYYKVTLSGNGGTTITSGGTPVIDSIRVTIGDTLLLSGNYSAEKDGHKFLGWVLSPLSTVDEKLPDSYEPHEDVTLYAIFEKENIYTIKFMSDSTAIAQGEVIEGDIYTGEIPNLSGTKIGHTFEGWLFNGEIFNLESPINQDIILTAKWTPNQYTITFNTDGGTTINPIRIDFGTTINYPDNPTKECNEFLGWDNHPLTMPAQNITIKAIWNHKCSRYSGGSGKSSGGGGRSSGGSSSRSEGSSNSASSKNEITLTTNKKTLNTDEYINLTIGTTNKYLGKLTLYAEHETTSGRTTIPNDSHTYFSDFSDEWSDGYYRMILADEDEITLRKLLKFAEGGYYRIYVKDTYGNSKYIQFHVNQQKENTNEEIITNSDTGDNNYEPNYEPNINQLNQTQENTHSSAYEISTDNTNPSGGVETYISRSCKSYTIQYIESLNAYTSPNLKKTEYFVNIDYFKRYIDSKNAENPECSNNKSRISNPYSDAYNGTDRVTAPNGKIYFIEQQSELYSSKQLKSEKSFPSIDEIKSFINKSNPLTNIN